MSNVQEIESAIRNLSAEDLAKFRTWFIEFDSRIWDKRLEQDVRDGKLDNLAAEALRDLQGGHCTDL